MLDVDQLYKLPIFVDRELTDIVSANLRLKAQLSLMSNGQYAHLILGYDEPIQGQVTCLPVRNDKFA